MTSAATSAATNAAVIIAEATKASGVICRLNPEDFLTIVDLNVEPLIVHALEGVFRKTHRYLTSYRGLAFYTKANHPLTLPQHCQVVEARHIWIPA